MASSLTVFPLAFARVGSSSVASNITQLRGHFLLYPLPPCRRPSIPFLSLAAMSRGKQFTPQTAQSAHYRSSQSACRSEIHPSSPQLIAHPHLCLLPQAFPLWKSCMKKTSGYWRCSASRLRAKRDGAYGRHMATFSKSYLYLTRPINHEQISFSVLLWPGQKALSSTDVEGKICLFLFPVNIKVIIILHWSNLNWKKMYHICVNVTFRHIRACGCHITPNKAKWSKAKHRHSRSLSCRRLMDREASWGVCCC